MKLLFALAAAILLLSSTERSHAQMPAGSAGLNSVVLKLFGNHDDFAVDADFQMLDEKQKPVVVLTMGITVSGGKLRADADLGTYRGNGITPQVASQIKEAISMGMQKTVSITRPDKGRMILLYPGRKLYEDSALPKEAAAVSAISKIQKTPLAKETVDGHPCVKNKVVLVDSKGRQQEMTTWEATDLKNFPVIVKLVEDGQNMVVHNRNIRLTKPDPSQFEIPAGYSKVK